MIKRITIELDEDLLARAKQALGQPTARATVEQALKRAAEHAEGVEAQRVARQREYLQQLASGTHADTEVLASESMWR
ncbi:MAG: type II toxin-antitoxin system VapB family antitoxin [Acidimicrobiales bacterium]